jgi:hypothetical protein
MDDRSVIAISVINRRRQELDTVAIGIKQIDIIRVPKTVPPRPELDIVAVAETARDIACPNDVVDAADDIAEVVQSTPSSVFGSSTTW